MKKIRIYQRDWGKAGGPQHFVGSIARVLAESNDVEIVHHEERFDLKTFEEEVGLDLSRVNFRYLPNVEKPEWNTDWPMARLRLESDFCRDLSESCDVFIAVSNVPPIFNHAKHGVLLTHFPSSSFDEYYAHSSPEWNRLGLLRRFWRTKYQKMEWRCRFASYQTHLCVSRFARQWCWNRWQTLPQVLTPPVREGVPLEEKKPLILAVGAFSAENRKRHDVIISAFQDFYDKMIAKFDLNPAWKLRLIGFCGENSDDLAFVEKLRLKAYGYPIEILTNASWQTIEESLTDAMFFWHATGYGSDEAKHPERLESFGFAVAEAQAAGAIPMVYHAGGMPEIIRHGMNGFLWSTFRELVETTTAVLVEDRILPILETGAIRNAENFQLPAFRKNLKKVLHGIVDASDEPAS